jgi:hypothetical protein|tara:strand:+ start:16 stop:429 length:414 start_codon:yes stop_codon:yes gene_type:complete
MGDASIKGRSPLLKGGRVGLKKGGGSAVWLRGRSGQTIKAPRGKAGWKQMQDYEAKIPKGTKGDIVRTKKIESAGPKENLDTLKNLGLHGGYGRGKPKGGSTKERRRLARVEDAMREKLLGSLGPKGRISNKKGGKA